MQHSNKSVWCITRSSDYDSLLSEAGDYTPKYDMAQAIISSALTVQTLLPARPAATVKRAFASTGLAAYLTVADIISQVVMSRQKHDDP